MALAAVLASSAASSSAAADLDGEEAELVRRLEARGKRVVFVDPQEIPTAKLLIEHGLIRWNLQAAAIAAALRATAQAALAMATAAQEKAKRENIPVQPLRSPISPFSGQLAAQCFRDRAGEPLFLDREQSAVKLLRLRFSDFKTYVRTHSRQPPPSAAASSSSAAAAPNPSTAYPLERRRLIATHSAPGGGKSHFLDALHYLHGPSLSRSAWATAVWEHFSSRPSTPMDDPYDSKTIAGAPRVADAPEFAEFARYMEQTVVVNCTFNDWQNGYTPGCSTELDLALRVLHRYPRALSSHVFSWLRHVLDRTVLSSGALSIRSSHGVRLKTQH
jgi:hypothetical protein